MYFHKIETEIQEHEMQTLKSQCIFNPQKRGGNSGNTNDKNVYFEKLIRRSHRERLCCFVIIF
jgi:hypothetical protein